MKKQTKIGGSIIINNGDIETDEDLIISGHISANRIEARDKTVVIGVNSEVTADINGGVVQIVGTLNGNVTASQLIQIEETATLNGDVAAPKIKLASRCRFHGQISYT
ncbi:MAG: polymer-forming cytoskeletal protein [Leptospiraceae bacterium]|nr:polymer-forming cytoskeletal protein [Leptospiraceae bacterium]